MAQIVFVVFLFIAGAQSSTTANESACTLPKDTCSQTYTSVYPILVNASTGDIDPEGGNITLPCSVASGGIPVEFDPISLLHLPFSSPGNYDLCKTFSAAHFCTLEINNVFLPASLLRGVEGAPSNTIFPLMTVTIGACISKACSGEDYKKNFEGLLNSVPQLAPLAGSLLKTTVVRCVDDTKYHVSGGAVLWFVLAALAVTLVAVGSLYEVVMMRHWDGRRLQWDRVLKGVPGTLRGEDRSESLLDWTMLKLSAFHNTNRLVAPIQGDFNSLNGMRFASMGWVILGHTVLTSISPPVVNQNAEVRYLQSVQFSIIKGAEFAVDTFFLMSGFLATIGVLKQIRKNGSLPILQYCSMVLARFLRLTPVYMFVLLFYWKVMPLIGGGPYWEKFAVAGVKPV